MASLQNQLGMSPRKATESSKNVGTSPGVVRFGSATYYGICAMGGALSCSSTHFAILPLDLIKCRIQANPTKFTGLVDAFKISLKEDGAKGLYRGWGATMMGYGAQGVVRFGLYEYFKIKFAEFCSPETFYNHRTLIYLAAAASAELLADIPLSPFESIKVRTQTVPGFPLQLRRAIPTIMTNEGVGGFYKSLIPLWGRQIPYTMVKFATFERTLEFLYNNVVKTPRDQLKKSDQLMVTFAAGYTAGVFCAIVSHPADTMVSKLQKSGASMASVYAEIGFSGLWKGLGPRILMIGSLAAAQWLIYDSVKVAFNLPRPSPLESRSTTLLSLSQSK